MNRELERKLRFIEKHLAAINATIKCPGNILGVSRSVALNCKIKEAKNLYEKVAEAELLLTNQVDNEDEFHFYQGWINQLESERQAIIDPPVIVEECNL